LPPDPQIGRPQAIWAARPERKAYHPETHIGSTRRLANALGSRLMTARGKIAAFYALTRFSWLICPPG
jgi:hypothetical protein